MLQKNPDDRPNSGDCLKHPFLQTIETKLAPQIIYQLIYKTKRAVKSSDKVKAKQTRLLLKDLVTEFNDQSTLDSVGGSSSLDSQSQVQSDEETESVEDVKEMLTINKS